MPGSVVEPKLCVTLPPDPNPHKPRFKPPPGTCDTHFHVFGPPHLFPYNEARRYTPPAAPIEHFFGMVHANPNLTETDHRELHAGGVRGVRFNCLPRNGGVFDQAKFQHVVSQIEALGWVVDLHLDPDFIEPHADLIRRVPLPLVIDHFANVHSQEQKEYKILFDLLGEKHIWLKISGADRLLSRGARHG